MEWGQNNTSTDIVVKRGLNVTIGGISGKYYGEWQQVGEITTPKGRGALNSKD